jgi:hypothetical protein
VCKVMNECKVWEGVNVFDEKVFEGGKEIKQRTASQRIIQ